MISESRTYRSLDYPFGDYSGYHRYYSFKSRFYPIIVNKSTNIIDILQYKHFIILL